jgi:hypothetical protein
MASQPGPHFPVWSFDRFDEILNRVENPSDLTRARTDYQEGMQLHTSSDLYATCKITQVRKQPRDQQNAEDGS